MVEPPARREIIVVYTWWRVVEAALGKHLAILEPAESSPEPATAMVPERVAAAAMVGIAAGCCQTWS
jgi:hypothetical protein